MQALTGGGGAFRFGTSASRSTELRATPSIEGGGGRGGGVVSEDSRDRGTGRATSDSRFAISDFESSFAFDLFAVVTEEAFTGVADDVVVVSGLAVTFVDVVVEDAGTGGAAGPDVSLPHEKLNPQSMFAKRDSACLTVS